LPMTTVSYGPILQCMFITMKHPTNFLVSESFPGRNLKMWFSWTKSGVEAGLRQNCLACIINREVA
jgi:hypothetical protein